MQPSLSCYFHRFDDVLQQTERPARFTYPFCYEPHPLCRLAAQQIEAWVSAQHLLEHHYVTQEKGEFAGKMFGVLIVENQNGELGYLAGFSGKLAGSNHHDGFVPPVYDMLEPDTEFVAESQQINALNQLIQQQTDTNVTARLRHALSTCQHDATEAIQRQQALMAASRKQRKTRREQIAHQPEDEQTSQLDQLARASVAEKRELAQLKQTWQQSIRQHEQALTEHQQTVDALKLERKTRSQHLQRLLFSRYHFLNALGQKTNLLTLFKDTLSPIPPAGSGECAAPKLLQFAYQHSFRPLAMAEFWLGNSPKSAIRQHGNFYPSCQGKCQPILTHMLQGLTVDPNPLLINPAENKNIDIIYLDDAIAIVHKPADMLSVPGVHIQDSAFTRLIDHLGPRSEGPFVVHRLDMSTSGLLVFALTHRANKHLQKQFIQRKVEKRYTAVIDGFVSQTEGIIRLPLAADPYDRPRQMVCKKHGKPAETHWQIAGHEAGKTRLHLYPKTGRTHQLRVHCAHPDGLNTPISGDDLYGNKGERLKLHAAMLRFNHPYTQQIMTFEVDADF